MVQSKETPNMRLVPASSLKSGDEFQHFGGVVVRVVNHALSLPAGKCYVVVKKNGVEKCNCWNKRSTIAIRD